MLRKILPILLAVIGLGAGAGSGLYLRSPPQPGHGKAAAAKSAGHAAASHENKEQVGADGRGAAHHAKSAPAAADGHEYVKLNNQFIVPVLKHGTVASMVILSLSLEVTQGGRDQVYSMEPKLRDAFLSVLFDHANAGGFDGNFISSTNMVTLRDALKEAAVKTLGPIVSNVLILDLVRQDA